MFTATQITYITPQELEFGAQGQDVKFLQKLLINNGYSIGFSGIDGIFGQDTYASVRKFQSNNGLKDDGIVGSLTWKALGISA